MSEFLAKMQRRKQDVSLRMERKRIKAAIAEIDLDEENLLTDSESTSSEDVSHNEDTQVESHQAAFGRFFLLMIAFLCVIHIL